MDLDLGKTLSDGTIDRELLEAACAGDGHAQEKLFSILIPLFIRLARAIRWEFRFPGGPELDEDMSHDVAVHFMRGDDERAPYWRIRWWLDHPDAPFEHWIVAGASNYLISLIASLKRRSQREVELTEDVAVAATGDCEVSLDTRDLIWECMARMNENQRNALYLRYYKGFSGSEIAKRMRISRNAVDQLMHRARIELGRLFREAMGDDPDW